ncbi:MAG: dTDP-4-dehydrorhamnose 3,5-epimerase family protein [archaeon]
MYEIGNIEGVIISSRKTILDDRGCIRHFMKCTDPEFKKFGEVYFSEIFPGVVKGWHLHTKMELNYVCIKGNIKLVLLDLREKSPTKNKLMEIYLGEKDYKLVKIPPGVLNGFTAIGEGSAIVANFTDMPYDPDEIKRIDPWDKSIGYNWKVKDR